jgi:hypothetical protein
MTLDEFLAKQAQPEGPGFEHVTTHELGCPDPVNQRWS